MSKTVIKGAVIVTLDDSRPDNFKGDIAVNGTIIEAITEYPQKIESGLFEKVIDGSSYIVMPGLVNTHGHAAMTLLRSYADDMPLKEWLEEKIWPIEELMQAEDVYWGTKLAIAEMIKSGTTTFTDMYMYMDRVAEAADESGIRAVLSRGLIGIDGGLEGLTESEEFIKNWQGAANGRITVTLGPHAPYTCPPEFLKKVISLAEKTGSSLQIHLSETRGEVDNCLEEHGKTPPELLNDLGIFNINTLAAHCVHLSDSDIDILAENGVNVAHNPGSNLKLGSGIAPVARMLDKGINVGIGTDGASSNNNLDMIEEMRLTALLSKGVEMNPTLLDAKTALKMSTIIGAKALKIDNIGILKEGYKADLIALRTDRPHLVPMHDPIANIVYSSAGADVDLVMVDGDILLENRNLTKMDEQVILKKAAECTNRLIRYGKDN